MSYVYNYVCVQNYVRVVEVWWDDYKDYFYASRPETLTLAYGDISELKRFRYNRRATKRACFLFICVSLDQSFPHL